jgi:type I restriction enzyme, S subunit
LDYAPKFSSIDGRGSQCHTTTQKFIPLGNLRCLPVPVCSTSEQDQIIRTLDEQCSSISALESDIDTNLQKAEALRQSILKKAFAGELVPQDPNDEPASQLLARIRAERAARDAVAKASSRRRTAALPRERQADTVLP